MGDVAKKGWYGQIGMSQDNLEKLQKLRGSLAKSMGVRLSWNDFVSKVMPYLEQGVKEETKK